MPFILQNPAGPASLGNTTQLTIRKDLFKKDKFSYRFSQMEFIVSPTDDVVEIRLIDHWTMRRHEFYVIDHCCTRPTALQRVDPDQQSQHLPEYGDNPKHVAYQIGLCDRELVQIGLIVRVKHDGKHITDLLCDPQVGSGPPSRDGFTPAAQFTL